VISNVRQLALEQDGSLNVAQRNTDDKEPAPNGGEAAFRPEDKPEIFQPMKEGLKAGEQVVTFIAPRPLSRRRRPGTPRREN
jgi:hypothetical protein